LWVLVITTTGVLGNGGQEIQKGVKGKKRIPHCEEVQGGIKTENYYSATQVCKWNYKVAGGGERPGKDEKQLSGAQGFGKTRGYK